MVKGIAATTVQRGIDVREFALLSFGGAGGVHAIDIADALDMAEVIVPPFPGVFSAIGLLAADVRHDHVAALGGVVSAAVDPEKLERAFAEMEDEARRVLAAEGFSGNAVRLVRSADLKVVGQTYELTVPLPQTGAVTADGIAALVQSFGALYRERYAFFFEGEAIELVESAPRRFGPERSDQNGAIRIARQRSRAGPHRPPAGLFREARLRRVRRVPARPAAPRHAAARPRHRRGADLGDADHARHDRLRRARPRPVHQAQGRVMTDVITMQVIRYALEQIADEMGNTLVRTGRSTIITEIKDISCVVCDAKGQTIAQAHHTPSLLAGFEITMRELVKTYRPDDLSPGDVIVTNDPYRGCQHIMDLYAIAPAFHGGELIGFVGNITHHTDLGGVAAGGVAGGIREISLEGLRLPMVKLAEARRRGQGAVRHHFQPDSRAGQDAGRHPRPGVVADGRRRPDGPAVPEIRWKAVVRPPASSCSTTRSGACASACARFRPASIAARTSSTTTVSTTRRSAFRSRSTIADGHAIVDLTGSDPQAEGNTNSTIANTYAAAYYVMIAVVDPGMPPNSGCYRPIEVRTRPGSVVDPLPPGAVAARTNCSQKIVEALLRALSQAVPDRVCAGGHAQITTCAIGGFDPETGERFIVTDIQGGGNGGRPYADGADGQDSHLPRFMNTPVESVEQRFPIRIERYELVPDSGGAGKFRGSLALRRDIRVLTGPVSFARYADRHTIAPQGLFGGKPGTPGKFELNPDSNDPRPLRSKGLDTLQANDLIRLKLPGAGGYGDPLARDLDAIERDLADGKVTPDAAEENYSVVVERTTLRIDRDATTKRRAKR